MTVSSIVVSASQAASKKKTVPGVADSMKNKEHTPHIISACKFGYGPNFHG
jgi:hypothetical protein